MYIIVSLVPRPRPAFRRFVRGESLGTRLHHSSFAQISLYVQVKNEYPHAAMHMQTTQYKQTSCPWCIVAGGVSKV